MTFKTTVRDGLIVINTHGAVPDGTPIEASTTRQSKSVSKGKTARTRTASRTQRKMTAADYPLPGFGAWKHRRDIGDTAEFARELRRRASSRQHGE